MSKYPDEAITTTDGNPPAPGHAHGVTSAPQPVGSNGQYGAYWVLSPEERAKGFIRPVRDRYVHVTPAARYPLRDLTSEEATLYEGMGYVKYEPYPEDQRPTLGKFWTAADLAPRCNTTTTMGTALAETYARDPKFYGATFCVHCGAHFPVEEFVWKGTAERVGT